MRVRVYSSRGDCQKGLLFWLFGHWRNNVKKHPTRINIIVFAAFNPKLRRKNKHPAHTNWQSAKTARYESIVVAAAAIFLVCERSAHSQKRYGKMCACVSVVAVASAGCCLSVAWLFGSCQFNENLLLFYMYGVCVWVRVCVYALLYFRTRRSVRFGLVGFWLACNVFLCSFFFSAGCSHTSSICCYCCRFFFY